MRNIITRTIRRPAMPKGQRYTWAHWRYIRDWDEGMRRYRQIISHVEARNPAIGRFLIRAYDPDGLGYIKPDPRAKRWLNFRILWFFYDDVKREEAFLLDCSDGYFLISFNDFWGFLLLGGDVDLLEAS